MVDTLVSIPGYRIQELIYAGSRTLVDRGQRNSDGMIVIKLMQNEFPRFNELIQFRNQYTIAKNLDIPGIVKPYSLEPYGNSYALVMEDFGAISLADYLHIHTQILSVQEFLAIALQVAITLDELHRQRVIHKDLKPANILINPDTKQVKITDFSIASLYLTTGAFTSDRVSLLNILCSQAAISLQNAHLYQQEQLALENLKQAQLQLVQSEKMSTLGNLVAGVAHEINNPVGFLVGNLQPALDYVQSLFGLIDLYQQEYPNPSVAIQNEIEAIDLEYLRSNLPKVNISKFNVNM